METRRARAPSNKSDQDQVVWLVTAGNTLGVKKAELTSRWIVPANAGREVLTKARYEALQYALHLHDDPTVTWVRFDYVHQGLVKRLV